MQKWHGNSSVKGAGVWEEFTGPPQKLPVFDRLTGVKLTLCQELRIFSPNSLQIHPMLHLQFRIITLFDHIENHMLRWTDFNIQLCVFYSCRSWTVYWVHSLKWDVVFVFAGCVCGASDSGYDEQLQADVELKLSRVSYHRTCNCPVPETRRCDLKRALEVWRKSRGQWNEHATLCQLATLKLTLVEPGWDASCPFHLEQHGY